MAFQRFLTFLRFRYDHSSLWCARGHKSVKNTLLYVQLAEVIFKETSDEFTTRAAKSVKGAQALSEAGFDFVLEMHGLKIFRKRK